MSHPAHRSLHTSPDKTPAQGAELHAEPGPASAPATPRHAHRPPPTNGTPAKMEPEPERTGKTEEENGHTAPGGGARLLNGKASGGDGGHAHLEGAPPPHREHAHLEGAPPHRTEEAGGGPRGAQEEVDNGHRKEGVDTEPKVGPLLIGPTVPTKHYAFYRTTCRTVPCTVPCTLSLARLEIEEFT